jgi:hypothetical protein
MLLVLKGQTWHFGRHLFLRYDFSQVTFYFTQEHTCGSPNTEEEKNFKEKHPHLWMENE